MLTELLLLATGFTGAFTLRFLWRMLCLMFVTPPTVKVHLATGMGSLEPLRAALKRARREVLVLARSFSARPIAQALIEARVRGVQVEMLLDAACERDRNSDVAFFLEQGFQPQVSAAEVLGPEVLLLIDGRIILAGGFTSPAQEGDDSAVNLLEIKGHPAVFQIYRQLVQDHREDARPAQKPQPVQPTLRSQTALPPERTAPAPAVVSPPRQVSSPAPQPAVPQPAAPRMPAAAPAPAAARPAPAPTAPAPAAARSVPAPTVPAPGSPAAATAAAAARLAASMAAAEPPAEAARKPDAATEEESTTPLPPGFDFAALRKAIQGAA